MDSPVIADKKPVILDLEPGTYYWCSCGRSKKQPFCDGSHKGSGFEPLKFDVKEKGRHALCNCKITKTPPFCDGAHKSLK